MACEKKLSETLLNLGLFPVLGTIEYAGFQPYFVAKGTPNTFDQNNGTFVVYDENGCPWVLPRDKMGGTAGEVYRALTDFGLKPGAHVPHSNDGGFFMREILPRLLAGDNGIEVPKFGR